MNPNEKARGNGQVTTGPPSSNRRESTTGTLKTQARNRCVRLLKGHLGDGGYRQFLRSRQPGMSDRTGRELLDDHPAELLARLEKLEGGGDA